MDRLLIRGGQPLHGEVTISGAKNAALPELCAALLTAQPVTLSNVPKLQDVATTLKVLRHLPAICAVVAPTVNSYKRLIPRGSRAGFTWAPIYVTYGYNNRTNMMRVPWVRPEIEARLREGAIAACFESRVTSIAPDACV